MIEIDSQSIEQFITQFINQFVGVSPLEMAWILMFKYWGWIIVLYLFLKYFVWEIYQFWRVEKWAQKNAKFVILAIDVPKRNEQSIQAMQNLFDQLAGAHSTRTKWAEYIEGEYQLSMSCELVSIGGNIQYLIRCPIPWRNLVEASVYGQFPDAEITEVEDYVNTIPGTYPNDTHEVWGTEFTLQANPVYPIKTWRKFEHAFAKTFVDPMAALLEAMSQLPPGHQVWIQILMTPIAVNWGVKDGKKEVDNILGRKPEAPKSGIIDQVFGYLSDMASGFTDQIAGFSMSGEGGEEAKSRIELLPNISPGEKNLIEGIENKVSQMAFNCKMRYLYSAPKGQMNKALGIQGVIGAIKQFNDMGANGLKPELGRTGTHSPQYILINRRRKWRQESLVSAYKSRSTTVGLDRKPMCSEELATIWHFPSMNVKAPFLKATDFTKAAAPVGLPMHQEGGLTPKYQAQEEVPAEEVAEETRVKPTFDYDSDDFEKQFAKDKKAFEESRAERAEQLKKVAQEEAEAQVKDIKTKEKEKAEAKTDEKAPGNLPFID